MQRLKLLIDQILHNTALVLIICSMIILLFVYLIEHIAGIEPCELCLIQRYPYYFVILFAFISFFTNKRVIKIVMLTCCLLALLTTISYAIYHVGIEQKLFESNCLSNLTISDSMEDLRKTIDLAPRAACDSISWTIFGLSLATWNVIISFILSIYLLFNIIRFSIKKEG